MDFKQIKGHEMAKRACAIALAGRHPILFIGPRGNGKTMLKQAMGHVEMRENIPSFRKGELTVEPEWATNRKRDEFASIHPGHFDIHIEVPRVSFVDLFSTRDGSSTADILSKIKIDRTIKFPPISGLSDSCKSLMKQAYIELGIDALRR